MLGWSRRCVGKGRIRLVIRRLVHVVMLFWDLVLVVLDMLGLLMRLRLRLVLVVVLVLDVIVPLLFMRGVEIGTSPRGLIEIEGHAGQEKRAKLLMCKRVFVIL